MRAEGTMGAIDPERLRVHVITSSGLVRGRGHIEVADAAVEGGADVVQLRAPELSYDELLSVAREIERRCRRSQVLFVVNDRIDIAVGVGGIDPSNARKVLAAGAAGVAVVSAVGTASDPVAATRRLVEIVRTPASVPGD